MQDEICLASGLGAVEDIVWAKKRPVPRTDLFTQVIRGRYFFFLVFGFHPLCRWQNFAGGATIRLQRFPSLVVAAQRTFFTTFFLAGFFFAATFFLVLRMLHPP